MLILKGVIGGILLTVWYELVGQLYAGYILWHTCYVG